MATGAQQVPAGILEPNKRPLDGAAQSGSCSPATPPKWSPLAHLTRHRLRYLCAIIGLLLAVILVLLVAPLLRPKPATGGGWTSIGRTNATGGTHLLASSSDESHHYAELPAPASDPDESEPDSEPPSRHHPQEETEHDHDHDQDHQDHHQQVPPSRPRPPSRPPNQQLRNPAGRAEGNELDVCMTPGCIRASAQLLNAIDNHTQPCQDFYQFACGRWIESQLIPDEKTSLSVFSQNTADLNTKLRALIERRPRTSMDGGADPDPPIVGQMRNLYNSCMNLSRIEARGDEPLLDVLRDLGGWPVLEPVTPPQVNSTSATRGGRAAVRRRQVRPERDWLDLLIKFRERGFSHDILIDLSVVPDVRQSRHYVIELDQSSLGLPDRSYYFAPFNDTTVAAYLRLMVESAVMLGADRKEAGRQMKEALQFEQSLARVSLGREQRRNVSQLYNKMKAIELYELAPDIDWRRYLNSLLRPEEGPLDLEREQVVVKVPGFLRSLNQLLRNTDPRVLANYMIWRIVRHSMSGLGRRWRELSFSYSTVTTGRRTEEPRWEQCLGALEGTLGTALSALYVRNHFNGRSKAAALEMVRYIKAEFLRILDEVDWMDEETRQEARLKAHAIEPYIGYPDELLDERLVERLYDGLQMRPDAFYENVRQLRIWSTNYAFSQLRRPNKRGDWRKHARAAVVNAFYNSLENSIEFPAGILQGAFFDAERPNYLNFGAIGYVIGHEITHGFDDRGRQFDKDGNDRNWWKAKTDAQFRQRAQCIVDQYANYTVAETGLRVNGLNTQGENIADNGGIKEAFRAYRRWAKDNGREPRLPGLAYSPDQLFWLSAANIWCGKFRPEVMRLRLNSGVHSPARFRIIGPLSNTPEFAASFNCPIGSPMNPSKKCAVW